MKPTTACLIHKFGCTRKQAVSATNSVIDGLFKSPNSVRAAIAFILFAATNSDESVKPYKNRSLLVVFLSPSIKKEPVVGEALK